MFYKFVYLTIIEYVLHISMKITCLNKKKKTIIYLKHKNVLSKLHRRQLG